MNASNNFATLKHEIISRWKLFLGGLSCLAMSSALFLLMPPWASSFLQETLAGGLTTNTSYQLIVGLGIFVAAAILGFARVYLLIWLSHDVTSSYRNKIFNHILIVSPRRLSTVRDGELISGFSNDVQIFFESFSRVLAIFIPSVLAVICFATAMIWYNWLLFLCLIVLMAPLVFSTSFFGRSLHKSASEVQSELAKLTSTFAETASATREIKSFGIEDRLQKTFATKNAGMLQLNLRRELMVFAHPMSVTLSTALSVAGLIFISLYMLEYNLTDSANLTSFLVCLGLCYPPLQEASHTFGRLTQLTSSLDRIKQILNLKGEIETGTEKIPEDFRGEIKFENVNYKHPDDRFRIDDINFALEPGETMYLVGRSGSGKSTLLEMVLRYIEPDAGRILIDGTDISNLDLKELRNEIGVVFQHPFIFEATLMENIRIGRIDATDSDVMKAAEMAHVTEFSDLLPFGLDTQLKSRGTNLSIGQAQRIAIARVLLRNPKLLLLDEPTTALDNELQSFFKETLEVVSQGRTTIVVAHDLSTIKNDNKVLVLDQGKVVEQGSHNELLRKAGKYRALYEAGIHET
ncbi:MAG: ABC transporter ATP-binding protein [Pseudomonadota bacterium]